MRNHGLGIGLFVVLQSVACVKNAAIREHAVTPSTPPVQGVWENSDKGVPKKMIFEAGGRLTFQGGLEFFNPGHWGLDPARQELTLTLPEAPDDKLQIFKLYVGEGVKAFDRAGKRITYAFNGDTGSLNVAGWTYSKARERIQEAAPEPVLK